MRAVTLHPGKAGSLRLEDVPERAVAGELRVQALAVGVCGTDRELIAGDYGAAPAGRERLLAGRPGGPDRAGRGAAHGAGKSRRPTRSARTT